MKAEQVKKRYIVVDSNNRPMSFIGNQLCYTPIKHNRVGRPSKHILESYTEKKALELIEKTIRFRQTVLKQFGEEFKYHLMQIKS